MNKEKLEEIFEHFGYENQRRKLVEEVNEFNDEVLLFEKGIGNIDDVIKEIADVLVLIEQFIVNYDIEKEEINEEMNYKIDRTIKRIEDKYYDRGEK